MNSWKTRYTFCLFILVFSIPFSGYSQGLLDELEKETEKDAPKREPVSATFKGTRLINGHSVEMPAKGELLFIISHRFGKLSTGFSELFGLDQATIRYGFEYSPTHWLNIGVGRSTYMKTYDGFIKARVLRQSKGKKPIPITMVLLAGSSIHSLKWQDTNRKNYFTSRMDYYYQIMIARKFTDRFSLQFMPSMVHKNLVTRANESNDIFSLGIGGRYKVSNRVAIMAEYHWLVPGQRLPFVNGLQPRSPLALGVDIETGGHIFQLQFTNAQAMFEKGFIAETTGNILKGDIHIGFNITRTFSFRKFEPKKRSKKG
ncbi:MAG: DUF5777 family beta-barrel protein [Flavobacteriales bacterium]|nr:DUF5777 family beta-barrel protein [Flavobacteriales bacterium]